MSTKWKILYGDGGKPVRARAVVGAFTMEVSHGLDGLWYFSVKHTAFRTCLAFAPPMDGDFDAARLAAEQRLREILTDALAAMGGEGGAAAKGEEGP